MKIQSLQAIVILSVIAFVQYGKAQDQPSAANTALAEELVSVMHLEQTIGMGFGKMKEIQEKTADSLASSPESKAMLQKTMDSSMNAASMVMSWDKLKPIYVSTYASVFTAEELQGAIDFYKTPIGQKWVEKQPQVSMAIMSKTMEMAMGAQQPMMDQLKKSMDALKALQMNTNALPSTTSPVPAASTPVSTH